MSVVRQIFSVVLIVAGIGVASVGIADVGTAWYEQYRAAHTPAPTITEIVPAGFESKLTIPRLQSALYVVNATSPKEFRRGPGYIRGSARPGEDGNTIIAGHRDTHFRVLRNIRVGDDIELESSGQRHRYRVASIEIVGAANTKALRAVYQRQLTLVTCYPFYYVGDAPKRFIVRAVAQ